MQKIFRLLLIASATVLGALWFVHWSRLRTLNSGEVHVRTEPENTPHQNAANPPQELASNDNPTGQPLSRISTSGVVAAGSGKFQLYRQGDLTFRLNTETGQACVLLATEAQWSKPLVYDHGCGSH